MQRALIMPENLLHILTTVTTVLEKSRFEEMVMQCGYIIPLLKSAFFFRFSYICDVLWYAFQQKVTTLTIS